MLYHLFYYWLEGANYAYKSVLFRGTCAILLAFLVVWWVGPRVIGVLIRLKLGETPEFDHGPLNRLTRDKTGTPTMGGVMIMIAILCTLLLLADLTNFYVQMGIFCLLWLAILGGVDDYLKLTLTRRSGTRDGLRMYEKLLFQIGLGVILAYFTYDYGSHVASGLPGEQSFRVLAIPFYKGPENTHGILLSIPAFMIVTVIVITGTSNAVNLTDGMNGLAGGCMGLASFVFMILAFVVGERRWADYLLLPYVGQSGELAVLCGAMVGACLGFLWYNCHPAQVWMGDTGSLPLGGLIGYVAIVTRQELMLLIVGGVFVIEAISVMIQVTYFKATGGKRVFLVAPIHHHYHLKGWTETQVVTRFWLVAAIFAAFALATVKLR